MNPRILMMAGLSLALSAFATDVRWGCFSGAQSSDGGLGVTCVFGSFFCADVGLQTTSQGKDAYLVTYRGVAAAFMGNWLEATEGEIINASTTRSLPYSSYLVHAWIDDGVFDDGQGFSVGKGEDFYLMFVCGEARPTGDPSYVYGWVQINVDNSGNLTLLNSAADFDGGPMIVGGGSASPEPSSALLLLLGAGVLVLRRRRSSVGGD